MSLPLALCSTSSPRQAAILGAKNDADLIEALGLVKREDQWEEQPDLYDW